MPGTGSGIQRRVERPGVPCRTRPCPGRIRRTAEHCHRVSQPRRATRHQVVAQARGPEPHRVAQDQQRPRPDASCQAHGQEAHRGRDRCRTARSRISDGGGPPRARVQGVHGGRRCRAPATQRVSYASPRCRSGGRRVGVTHSERRSERSNARLGRHGRVDALLPRVGDGSASVPVHGAPVPHGHRSRSARAVRRHSRRCARRRRGVRGWRVECDRNLLRLRRRADSARGRRASRWRSGGTRCARRGARHEELPHARRARPGAGSAFDLRRSRLPGSRAGAFVARIHRSCRVPDRHRRRSDRRLPVARTHRGHHPRARVRTRSGLDRARSPHHAGPDRAHEPLGSW